MSSAHRRPRLPASRLPLRTTSYRSSSADLPADPPADHSSVFSRSTKSQRRASLHVPATLPTVTAESLSITLPVPPSVNHQYATVNGRRLLSSTGRLYKSQVGRQVWTAVSRSPVRHMLMSRLQTAPLALSIRFFFTSSLRRDVDGGLKIAQDALCEGLGLNDNRIVETHLYKHTDKANPRVEVFLSPVG